MTALDLNALMNMRGAGNAQKVLQLHGLFNPLGPASPDDKEFDVTVTGTATWSKTVKVWAEDAEAAEEIALNHDFEVDDFDDIEIDDATAEEPENGTSKGTLL